MELFNLGGWRRKTNRNGRAQTATYRQDDHGAGVVTVPMYREHLRDLFVDRTWKDSRSLMQEMFKSDPDVSAAVNSYLTVANTEPRVTVLDRNGGIDREGHAVLEQVISRITAQTDFSQGFQFKQSLAAHCADMRYMALLRGGIGAELVFDRTYAPAEIRQVDLASIEWVEKEVGKYKPRQRTREGKHIDLDVPTFFVGFFRRDPTNIYATSHFVSAINTIAARQQVINDLYRIMYATGFPRIDVQVMEEVLRNGAPASVKASGDEVKWVRDQISAISAQFASLRADQAFVHTDSVKASVINDRNPGAGININSVVDVLNGQNQAALKVMATIIGRGESGVNTASVEARIFALNADELNVPVAEMLSRMFTFALAMQGRQNLVKVEFRPVELRPWLELEAQFTMKQTRLLEALSLGVISDDEFHIEMFGRPRPEASPILTGTGFFDKSSASVDATKITPNADPLGRSLSPEQ